MPRPETTATGDLVRPLILVLTCLVSPAALAWQKVPAKGGGGGGVQERGAQQGGGAGGTVCEICEVALLACGESVDGVHPANLDCISPRGTGLDIYSITVEEDTRLVVSVNGDYDTYLHLFDVDCFEIASDDDGGEGLNSRMVVDVLAGAYFVGVSSYGAGQGGAFTLSVECGGFVDVEVVCEDCEVALVDCGETVAGVHPENAECVSPRGNGLDIYSVSLKEDARLVVSLTGDYDTYLHLYDGTCQEIASDDDGGDGFNSRMAVDVLAGTYFVGVSSFGIDQGGAFTLSVECREIINPDDVCADCQVGTIECGETVAGDFPATGCPRPGGGNNQNVDLHVLEVTEETSFLTISLDAAFDTYLVLLDSGCLTVSENDDGGVGLNSLILTAVDPGTYYVGVSSYASGAAGAYQLAVDCGEAPDTCVDCNLGIASCGITEANQFPRGDCRRQGGQSVDLYDLVLGGGEVTIDLTGTYDTWLQLYDETCTVIAEDDDGGDGLNSRLVLNLGPGVYQVGVSSYASGATGDFELTATCFGGENFCIGCRVAGLQPGDSRTATFPETECTLPPFDERIDVYTFALTEPFRGTIRVTSDAFDPTLALFDEICEELDFNDNCSRGTTNSCLEVNLQRGFHSIVVSSRDIDARGNYTVIAVPEGAEGTRFYRGDTDGNGTLALSDAVSVFQHLFQGGAAPACRESADANNDAAINLTDGVHVLNYLFLQGDPPSLPGPPGVGAPCGLDPDKPASAGDLGCDVYEGC